MDKKSLYIIIVAVIIIVAAVLLYGKGYFKPGGQTPANAPAAPAQSNAPAIVNAVTSRSIDAKGNATGVTTTFDAKSDKIVYAVLALRNIIKSTTLSYVRYLNGKYIDSKVSLANKDGITNFYFAFEKGIGDYPAGTYTLNLYINGARVQSLNYVFK